MKIDKRTGISEESTKVGLFRFTPPLNEVRALPKNHGSTMILVTF